MHQSLQGATFHVEHIVPRCLGGLSKLENLAWACPSCNLHKSNRVEVQVVPVTIYQVLSTPHPSYQLTNTTSSSPTGCDFVTSNLAT